uniref:Type IV pilus assembly protein PilC n=1 Tax=uncultured delta proteobacterium TaxID=34034 RepID=H5SJE2_9DELT|nr:type IV pilus assembly protein PilC [uncultured delta proteobacterium]
MPEFVYEAKTRAGELRKGFREADSEEAVANWLRSQQLLPVQIKKKPREINLTIGSGVSPKELVVFTRQFGTMIDAGLPLVQCLDILSSQNDNPIFAKILKDVKASVEQGKTFSDALSKHPKIFDSLYVNLVRAGEVGGILDTILARLAVYIEKRVKLARQVRGALVYPTAIMIIAVLVVSVLLTWVIPTFEKMFADFGAKDDLPALTQFVINLSKSFVNNLPWIVLSVLGVVGSVTYGYKTPGGRELAHRLLLEIPLIGPVMRKIAVARFTRTLGTLLSSGVPILDALEIVASTAGNVVIEKAILSARAKIAEGKTMADPLMETKVFPPMVVQMIGVGEQTGALDTMLNKIADFYEEEVDIAVAALTSLLEPLMMVVIGGITGTMIIAMYLPIFEIAGKIKSE